MLDRKELFILVIGDIPIFSSGIVSELYKAGICNVLENNEWKTPNSETGDHIPDVIIVDVDRVDTDLLGYVRNVQCNYPGVRILMLCPELLDTEVCKLMKMGISGMLKKGEPPENLILALQTVAVGQSWFSACFAEKFASLSVNNPETLLT